LEIEFGILIDRDCDRVAFAQELQAGAGHTINIKDNAPRIRNCVCPLMRIRFNLAVVTVGYSRLPPDDPAYLCEI
jgi:hypothetical protein